MTTNIDTIHPPFMVNISLTSNNWHPTLTSGSSKFLSKLKG